VRTSLHEALVRHLDWWGLRRFDNDASYFQWQRDSLSTADLRTLHRLIDLKRSSSGNAAAEVAFYDQAAAPNIFPVLHSQQYEYYLTVGPEVAERIGSARTALDFGCGIGLLTTYYARQYPETMFVGMDRSPASIRVAQDCARRLNLANVRFEVGDVECAPLTGPFDLIIATHALLQAEQNPGLPSRNWQTLERSQDLAAQAAFEQRTGLGVRMDRLGAALSPQGRAIVFEKTRQLARRVPFQRALATRGFTLLENPIPLGYSLVGEATEDGPLYVLGRTSPRHVLGRMTVWNEEPEEAEINDLYRCRDGVAGAVCGRLPARIPTWAGQWDDPELGHVQVECGRCAALLEYLYVTINGQARGLLVRLWHEGAPLEGSFRRAAESVRRQGASLTPLIEETWRRTGSVDSADHAPIYENHTIAAMAVWTALQDRTVLRQNTFARAAGEEAHIELGIVPTLAYLYFSNTFDQRQIVLMERTRLEVLEQYFSELLAGFTDTTSGLNTPPGSSGQG